MHWSHHMIAFLDVQYSDDHSTARAAILLADQWTDGKATWMNVVDVADVAPYQPGEFFRRELPCLQKALESAPEKPSTIVIDGYVLAGYRRSTRSWGKAICSTRRNHTCRWSRKNTISRRTGNRGLSQWQFQAADRDRRWLQRTRCCGTSSNHAWLVQNSDSVEALRSTCSGKR